MADSQQEEIKEQPDLPMLLIRTEHLLRRYHQIHSVDDPHEIDPRKGQGRILALLQKTGDITQKELSYLLDLRQQSLSELLQKLEQSGYITRLPDPKDRRSVCLSLTEKGKGAKMMNNDLSDAFSCLNDEERGNLGDYLTRVDTYLEEDLRGAGDLPPMHGFGRGPARPPMGPGFGGMEYGPRGPMEPPMPPECAEGMPGFGGPQRPPMGPGFDGPHHPPMGPEFGGPHHPPMGPEFGGPQRPPMGPEFGGPQRPPMGPGFGGPERPPMDQGFGGRQRPPHSQKFARYRSMKDDENGDEAPIDC